MKGKDRTRLLRWFSKIWLRRLPTTAGWITRRSASLKRNLPGPFTFVLDGIVGHAATRRSKSGVRSGSAFPDNADSAGYRRGGWDAPLITTSVKDDDEVVEYTTDPELIHERYGRDVELVIDGGVGDTVPTTVVDLTGGEPEILREGKGVLRE